MSGALSNLYLIIATLAAGGGMIFAGRRAALALKNRWIAEAQAKDEQLRAQRENTRALGELTSRVEALADRIDSIDGRLRGAGL